MQTRSYLSAAATLRLWRITSIALGKPSDFRCRSCCSLAPKDEWAAPIGMSEFSNYWLCNASSALSKRRSIRCLIDFAKLYALSILSFVSLASELKSVI